MGQFGPGVTADQLAAPNALWALSFEVDTTPAAANPDVFGFDTPFTDFSYMLNGLAVAVTPESIRFYTSADGGLFTIFFGPETGFFNGMPIPEFSFSGDQVFSGTTTSPVILSGGYPVRDVTYSDAINFDDEGASGTVTITGTSSTTPEPSDFSLCLAALALLLFARLCRRSRWPGTVKLIVASHVGRFPARTGYTPREGVSPGTTRNTRWAGFVLVLAFLPGTARAQFSKTIYVVPNVQVNAVTTWYVGGLSGCTLLGTGTYSTTTAPQHGTLSFGVISAAPNNCPEPIPAAVAYYTWTDNTPGVSSDSFQLLFMVNGQTEADDISVLNTQAQPGKSLGNPAPATSPETVPNSGQTAGICPCATDPIDIGTGNVSSSSPTTIRLDRIP
jgi:hypothetical protein